MENTTYKNNKRNYDDKRKDILSDNESPWFYKKIGLEKARYEKELDEKMKELRNEYRSKHENMRKPFPPAKPFYNMKKTIEKCDLYNKVFKKMPKGGLLHVHSSAALSCEGFLELLKLWVEKTDKSIFPDIYIVTIQNERQDKVAVGTLMYDFQVIRENLKDYVEPLRNYLKHGSNCDYLIELLSFGSDRINQFPYLWDEFNTIFSRTRRLFIMSEFYYLYHIKFFNECIEDNIRYVELRCGYEEVKGTLQKAMEAERMFNNTNVKVPESHYTSYTYKRDLNIKANPWSPDSLFLDILMKAEEDVNKTLSKEKKIHVKVILCARRSLDPDNERELDTILKKVDTAIVLKSNPKYSKLILGFDFASEEDRGRPTSTYIDKIIYANACFGYSKEIMNHPTIQPLILKLQNMYGGKTRIEWIDFYLHDGESNWNDNYNVVDAAIVSKSRIGHGFSMNKIQGCVRDIGFIVGSVVAVPKEPVLEICPISNQLLNYYPDLRNHPAYELMKQGIACCISNDDPQIFGNPGLSYDFWEAYVGMWLDLDVVKALVFISFRYYANRCLEIEDESRIKALFLTEWQTFVTAAYQALGGIVYDE